MANDSRKKIVGSVAVDSETGMEDYQVPKKVAKTGAKKPEVPTDISPNYGETKSGESKNLAGVPDEFMNLFEHDASEIILKQALKHPIGSWFIYGSTVVTIFLVMAGMYMLLTDSAGLGESGFSPAAKAGGAFVALILVVLIVGISFAAVTVYRKSRLVLTNQKLVYIRYHSLFSREISQLNIGEVEDVNVSQSTIWDRLFRMGTITIETAGEQNNYVFTHVSDPHNFARLTIQAHEGSIAEYGN